MREQKHVLDQVRADRQATRESRLGNGAENVMGVLNFTFAKTYDNLKTRYSQFINNTGPIDRKRCNDTLSDIRTSLLFEVQTLEEKIKQFPETKKLSEKQEKEAAEQSLKIVKTALRGLDLYNHKKYLNEQEVRQETPNGFLSYFYTWGPVEYQYTISLNNTYEGNPTVPDLLYLAWCAANDANITTSTVEARQFAFILGLERATRSHNRQHSDDLSFDDGQSDKKACSFGFMGMILEVFSTALHAEHPDIVFTPALNDQLGEDAKKCLWKVFNQINNQKAIREAWMANRPSEEQKKLIEILCALTKIKFEEDIKKYGEPITDQEKNQFESFREANIRNMPYLALPPVNKNYGFEEKNEKEGKEVKEMQEVKERQEHFEVKGYGSDASVLRLDNVGMTGPYSSIGVPQAPMLFPYNPTGDTRLQARMNNGVPQVKIAIRFPKKSINHIPRWIQAILIRNGINYQNEESMDIFWVAQDRPWHKNDKILFRPHGWLHPGAPELARGVYSQKSSVSVSIFGLNGKVTQEEMVGTVLHTHKEADSPMVVFSQDQFPITQGIEASNETHCFYTLCIDKDKKRAALTLHTLLNDLDVEQVEKVLLRLVGKDKITCEDVMTELAPMELNKNMWAEYGLASEAKLLKELDCLLNGGERENSEYRAEQTYKIVERLPSTSNRVLLSLAQMINARRAVSNPIILPEPTNVTLRSDNGSGPSARHFEPLTATGTGLTLGDSMRRAIATARAWSSVSPLEADLRASNPIILQEPTNITLRSSNGSEYIMTQAISNNNQNIVRNFLNTLNYNQITRLENNTMTERERQALRNPPITVPLNPMPEDISDMLISGNINININVDEEGTPRPNNGTQPPDNPRPR